LHRGGGVPQRGGGSWGSRVSLFLKLRGPKKKKKAEKTKSGRGGMKRNASRKAEQVRKSENRKEGTKQKEELGFLCDRGGKQEKEKKNKREK